MNKGIYQDRKTGKWYIHTTIKGKTCTIRGYDSKKQADNDYDKAIKEWSIKHNLYLSQSILLKDLCNNYFENRKVNMSQGTLHKDKSQERKLLATFGNAPITLAFNYESVQKFYTEYKNDYRFLNYYKSLMSFAYDRQLIDKDYSSLIVLPKTKRKANTELKIIPPKVKQAFLDTIKNNNEYFIMFTLFAYLGCRLSEFLGICYDCVDLERKQITIKRQLLTNGKLTDVLKTSNSYRIIPLNDECVKLLRHKCKKITGRVFPISHTSFKRVLKKYLPDYSSHSFRHTRASELGAKCSNLGDVLFCASWLGHSPSMFLNTYCHNLDNNVKDKFLL